MRAATLGLDVLDVVVRGAVMLWFVSWRLNSGAGVPTGLGPGSGALNTNTLEVSLAPAATGVALNPLRSRCR